MPHRDARMVIGRLVELGVDLDPAHITHPEAALLSEVMAAAVRVGLDLGLLFHSPVAEATMALASSAT